MRNQRSESREERKETLTKGDSRMTRLPVEPLMKELRALGTSEFARAIGASRWTVLRMKKSGLTIHQADELAIRFAGCHPVCIWGWAFFADIAATDDEFGVAA